MARMIPEFIDSSTKSDAEKKLFAWFKESENTKNWTVLHSERINDHVKLMQGEVDFLICVPSKGIFAIEVKGGQVSRKDGVWEFEDRYGNIARKARSPFEQASDGMFSIQKYVRANVQPNSNLNKVLFGYGVMFPDIVFNVPSPEYSQEQVFDLRYNKDVSKFIDRLTYYYTKKMKDTLNVDVSQHLPTRQDINVLVELLRPNFEKYVSLKKKIENSEDQIVSLTDEQYNVLDQLGDNQRILIVGGAGTGKTILAVNALKRYCDDNSNANKKIGLFCYNSKLAEWIKETTAQFTNSHNCFIGSLHSFFFSIIKAAGIQIDSESWERPDFYDKELPLLAIEALKAKPLFFDEIYIDESQDIFNLYYFAVIDLILNGGLKHGRWIMFADFDNQNLFIDSYRGEKNAFSFLDEWGNYIKYRLNLNCRNTEHISKEVEIVSNVKYKNIINQAHGIPVEFIVFSDSDDEKQKFIELINRLESEGIHKRDIVILSPIVLEKSIVSKTDFAIDKFSPSEERKKGKLAFSTIQSFKGLENSIIVVVDINENISESLLYVAFSRARSALYIVENQNAYKTHLLKVAGKQ